VNEPIDEPVTWPVIDLAGDPDAGALAVPGGGLLRRHQLAAEVSALAAGLVERGVGPGDVVGLVGANGAELAVAFLGISAVAAVAPLNPVLPAAELAFELTDLGLRALVVVGGRPPIGVVRWPGAAVAVAERVGVAVWHLDPRPEGGGDIGPGRVVLSGPALAPKKDRAAGSAPLDPEVALVLHTSGTTARPKTVPLTRANLAAGAAAVATSLALTPDDVGIEVMPLFHVHGLVASLLAPLAARSTVVCTAGFHAPDFASWCAGPAPTWYSAVPTMHLGLAERLTTHPGEAPARPLRLVRSSSAALAPQLMARIGQLLGVAVVEAYGMTEAAHQIASNPLGPGAQRPGTVGRAAGPAVAVRVDDDDAGPGRWAEPGQAGEVVIRGANVTAGYLAADPSVHEAAFVEGWLRTGDLGRLDEDGFLTITGRLKEIINRGGEKISPREVDEVLLDHPAVAQAVTFAVPDPRLGETVAAAVVAAPAATPAEGDLRQFVAQRLAIHKVPRRVLVLERLPTGPTGKLTRIGLAARLGLDHPDGLDRRDGHPMDPSTGEPPASPEVEAFVADRWVEVLGLADRPGPDQHFLDLGGDSMAAGRLLATLGQQLDLTISVLDLFDRPTVAGQARLVEGLLRAEPDP
jgi:acyl-CoA synthetase (AMP-forming)/AMP-acid ligase II/acyl carrier protein